MRSRMYLFRSPGPPLLAWKKICNFWARSGVPEGRMRRGLNPPSDRSNKTAAKFETDGVIGLDALLAAGAQDIQGKSDLAQLERAERKDDKPPCGTAVGREAAKAKVCTTCGSPSSRSASTHHSRTRDRWICTKVDPENKRKHRLQSSISGNDFAEQPQAT